MRLHDLIESLHAGIVEGSETAIERAEVLAEQYESHVLLRHLLPRIQQVVKSRFTIPFAVDRFVFAEGGSDPEETVREFVAALAREQADRVAASTQAFKSGDSDPSTDSAFVETDHPRAPTATVTDHPRAPTANVTDNPRGPTAAVTDKPPAPSAAVTDGPLAPRSAESDYPRGPSNEDQYGSSPPSPTDHLKQRLALALLTCYLKNLWSSVDDNSKRRTRALVIELMSIVDDCVATALFDIRAWSQWYATARPSLREQFQSDAAAAIGHVEAELNRITAEIVVDADALKQLPNSQVSTLDVEFLSG